MKPRWKKIDNRHAEIICPYCLKPIPFGQESVDHEPPKSRQTELGPSKLIVCCKKCNHEKGALTATEYKQWKDLNSIRVGLTKGKEK